MTDARLAAAVEAAARADCRLWDELSEATRAERREAVEIEVEAALAAADAWDAANHVVRLTLTGEGAGWWSGKQYRFAWLGEDQEDTQEPQKPPQDGRAGSGGTPGPQVGDEGSGGGFREPRPATR